MMDCKLSSDGKIAYCTFNDLSQFDPDKTGKLDPVGLFMVIREAGESGWIMHDRYGVATAISKGSGAFLVTSWVRIYPAFYSYLSTKMPAQCEVSIVHVGRTSFVQKTDVKIKDSEELVSTVYAQFVLVNLVSRRPTRFPESFVSAYIEQTKLKKPTLHVRFSNLPPFDSKLYCHRTVVSPCDIDVYNHAKNSSYIKYCTDCVKFGALEGAYSLIKGNIHNYPITLITLVFFNELVLHDDLMVTSWEDKAKPFQIHFTIRKKDKDIMQCTFTFDVEHLGSKL
ncbi:uncharacterized protein [Ptychodera flava]|uniref:uncharacterized protein n=1 Tax=Ptychodera flava TaxID=63121 RepID=UPI00396A48CD